MPHSIDGWWALEYTHPPSIEVASNHEITGRLSKSSRFAASRITDFTPFVNVNLHNIRQNSLVSQRKVQNSSIFVKNN